MIIVWLDSFKNSNEKKLVKLKHKMKANIRSI